MVDETGLGSALVIDAENASHISYAAPDSPTPTIRLAQQANGAWQVKSAPSLAGSEPSLGAVTRLALDAQGAHHIAYISYNQFSQRLYYVTDQQNLDWQTPVVLDSVNFPSPSSVALAVDAANRPHVTYCAQEPSTLQRQLRYTHFDGSQWINTQIANEECWYASALAFDNQGILHTAFYSMAQDGASGVLKHGKLLNGAWAIDIVDDSADAGRRLSLALGSDDLAHILYTHTPASQAAKKIDVAPSIKYAHQVAGQWQVQATGVAQSDGGTGEMALALDSADQPSFVYAAQNPAALVFAWRDRDAWRLSGIEQEAALLQGLALQIDSGGSPRVAYSLDKVQKYAVGRRVTLPAMLHFPLASR
ncbi:MAG: hypothetical protein IAE81_21465 [Caldilineaceae bacterium]|nr:hypothetical protein [Caldilineaceae bacterium]